MKPEERRQRILDLLQALQKEIRVEELADMLKVSQLTIRRDLEELANKQTIIRTHGGCLSVGRAALETEYHKKVAENFSLKRAIGIAAASRVEPGQTLLLNDGSTTFHLVTQLGTKQPLTVYSNSLAVISVLSVYPGISLNIIGGFYNNDSYSLRGSLAERMLDDLYFDLVFLGADAIDDEGRCMVATPEEARFTQMMMRKGRRRILLADHTKAGRKGYVAFGRLSDFSEWITSNEDTAADTEVTGGEIGDLAAAHGGVSIQGGKKNSPPARHKGKLMKKDITRLFAGYRKMTTIVIS